MPEKNAMKNTTAIKMKIEVRNLLRTLSSILDHVPLDSFYRKHLWQIKKLSTSKGLRDAIEKRFLRQAYE